jgi:sugar lactone lactonase YvrE
VENYPIRQQLYNGGVAYLFVTEESCSLVHVHTDTAMAEPESIDGGKAWYRCPKGPMVLGEAPIYRASDSTLHWVDCLSEPPELYILKVDPDTGDAIGEARMLQLEDSVTVAFFRKNKPGSYIAAYYQGICFLDEETGKMDVVKEIIPTDQREGRRFNDGGIDAKGRFWLAEIDKKAMAYGANQLPASYGPPRGRLWRYDPDGSLHLMIEEGIICGNGLGWSPDNKTSRSESIATVSPCSTQASVLP